MSVPDKKSSYRGQKGFTLIESVVGIVVFGFSMILLATTVFPMFAHSPDSLFETRASALGQAVMSKVSAAQFDKSSDPSGSGRWRCGESAAALKERGISTPTPIPPCTPEPKAPSKSAILAVVDDYIGCWGEIEKACKSAYRGKLSTLIGNGPMGSEAIDYSQFVVEIGVAYDSNTFIDKAVSEQQYKRIDVAVITPKHGRYDFTSYRSNY